MFSEQKNNSRPYCSSLFLLLFSFEQFLYCVLVSMTCLAVLSRLPHLGNTPQIFYSTLHIFCNTCRFLQCLQIFCNTCRKSATLCKKIIKKGTNNIVSNYFLLRKQTPSLRERAGTQGQLKETPPLFRVFRRVRGQSQTSARAQGHLRPHTFKGF